MPHLLLENTGQRVANVGETWRNLILMFKNWLRVCIWEGDSKEKENI